MTRTLNILGLLCLLLLGAISGAGAATMTAAASTAQGGGIVTAVPVNGVMPLFPLLGVGTTFSATPPTVSGVAGCSVSSPVYTDATHETFTLTTGSATGTLTITDPTTGATTTVTISPEPTNVVYNQNFDALTVGSSAGWVQNGTGAQVRNTFAYPAQVPFSGANMFGMLAAGAAQTIYTGMPAAGDMQMLFVQPVHLILSGGTITGSDTLGPILRSSASLSAYYEFSNAFGTNAGGGSTQDFAVPSFAQTINGNITTMPRQIAEGDYIWTRAESVGSVIRTKFWLNGAQSEPALWSATSIETRITAAGYAGLYSGSNNGVVDNLTIYSSVPFSTTMTAAPASLNAGTTGNTVTLTGTNTAWTNGTTFSVTGVAGASITATTINTTTQIATLTVSPGTTAGTLTYSDSLDPATATQTVVAVPVTFTSTNTGIFYSPYNWYFVAGTSSQTNDPGAYFKTTFTGTTFVLKTDSTDMQTYGISAPNSGNFQWSIDGGAFQTANLPNGVATTSLASGLATGSHTLLFYNYYNYGGNKWGVNNGQIGVADQLKITGFILDASSTLTQPTLQAKRAIFYGDSITQGRRAINASDTPTGDDAIHNYSGMLASVLVSEYGQVGTGSQGWEQAGDGATPSFFTVGDSTNSAWDKLFVGQSRLVGGLFSPAPDYVFENEGTNGASSTTPARVQGWLGAVRAAAPLAKIFCIIPFGGFNRNPVTNGYNAYQAATPDASAYLIDIGNQPGISGPFGTPSFAASDSLHPYAVTHGQIAALLAKAVQAKLTPSTSGTKRRIQ